MPTNNDKKVLLRISHLKQYFPVGKKSVFNKHQEFVHANDDISIDIYEGETFGLVGESGCGKSTFGRTLLQLYHQTDGKTMYYGRTLDSLAPEYVKEVLKDLPARKKKWQELDAKCKEFLQKYESLSQEEQNRQKEEKDKIVKETNDAYLDIAQLVGGFITLEDMSKVSELFSKKYEASVNWHQELSELESAKLDKEDLEAKISELTKAKKDAASLKSKLDAAKSEVEKHEKIAAEKQAQVELCEKEIEQLREQYANDEEFRKHEQNRDEGIDLAKLNYNEMRQLRRDLQLIFQDPYSSLNPRMTVGQIIGEGLLAHKFFKSDNAAMQEYILKVMTDCGLQPFMLHRYPHQFSGGQRQRIGIARSLAVKPKFVVCDEAVSALDVSIQSQVLNLLSDLKKQENLTYLFITHDLSVVKYISDRIGVMYLGNMVELATSEELFRQPLHPYTEALISAIPTTDVDKKHEAILLEGDIPSPIHPPKGCKFHTRCRYCTEICEQVTPDFKEVEPGHFVACHHILDHKVL